jgi:hypothetical protein
MVESYTDNIARFPTDCSEGIIERCWPRSRAAGARLAVPIRRPRGPWRPISTAATYYSGEVARASWGSCGGRAGSLCAHQRTLAGGQDIPLLLLVSHEQVAVQVGRHAQRAVAHAHLGLLEGQAKAALFG